MSKELERLSSWIRLTFSFFLVLGYNNSFRNATCCTARCHAFIAQNLDKPGYWCKGNVYICACSSVYSFKSSFSVQHKFIWKSSSTCWKVYYTTIWYYSQKQMLRKFDLRNVFLSEFLWGDLAIVKLLSVAAFFAIQASQGHLHYWHSDRKTLSWLQQRDQRQVLRKRKGQHMALALGRAVQAMNIHQLAQLKRPCYTLRQPTSWRYSHATAHLVQKTHSTWPHTHSIKRSVLSKKRRGLHRQTIPIRNTLRYNGRQEGTLQRRLKHMICHNWWLSLLGRGALTN